jgi:hypothetical protein
MTVIRFLNSSSRLAWWFFLPLLLFFFVSSVEAVSTFSGEISAPKPILLTALVTITLILIGSWLFRARSWESLFSFLYAGIVPLFPLLGFDLVTPLGILFLGVLFITKKWRGGLVGGPVVLLVAVWGGATLAVEAPLLNELWRHETVNFSALPLKSIAQLKLAALLFLSGSLLEYWRVQDDARRSALVGFLVGGTIALLLSSAQALLRVSTYGAEIKAFFPRQLSIWDELGRSVGTFTDPNAFGVFSALFLGLVIARLVRSTRTPFEIFPLALVVLFALFSGLLSGSRTFLLFIGFLAIALLPTIFRILAANLREASWGRRALFLILFLLSVTGVGWIFLSLSSAIPLRTLDRVLASIEGVVSGDYSLLSNRWHFSRIAFEIFRDHPITGIGPHRFNDLVSSYADLLGIPLALWRDNPNNTYLGILAECGLFGVLAVLLSVRGIDLKGSRSFPREEALSLTLVRAVLIAFLGVLFVGPHYLFPEVSLLVAFLLSFLVRNEQRVPSLLWCVLGVVLFLPVFLLTLTQQEHGVFHFETSSAPQGYLRWTAKYFRGWEACEIDSIGGEQVAFVTVRNGQPNSVTVQLARYQTTSLETPSLTSFGRHLSLLPSESPDERFTLRPGEQRTVPIACPHYGARSGILVEGRVSRSWQPVRSGVKGDPRSLGVQLYYTTPGEVLHSQRIDNSAETQ